MAKLYVHQCDRCKKRTESPYPGLPDDWAEISLEYGDTDRHDIKTYFKEKMIVCPDCVVNLIKPLPQEALGKPEEKK